MALLVATLIVPFVAALAPLSVPPSSSFGYGAWAWSEVDSSHAATHLSVAVDSSGTPHVAVWIQSLDILPNDHRYEILDASPDGFGGWKEQVVAQRGAWPTLQVGANGLLGLAYEYETPAFDSYLSYARRVNGQWVDDSPTGLPNETAEQPALALDAQGYAHIAWTERILDDSYGGLPLFYSWEDATGWHTVHADSHAGADPSIALDTSGGVHIAYIADPNGDGAFRVTLANLLSNGTWSIDRTGMSGAVPSLAYDKESQPHIAYDTGSDSVLSHAWKDVTGWHTEVIDTDPGSGYYPQLVIGTDNVLQIATTVTGPPFNNDIWYGHINYLAKAPGKAWTIDPVDDVGVTWFASLALDAQNQPHVAYIHMNDQAFPERGSWQAEYAVPLTHAAQDPGIGPANQPLTDPTGWLAGAPQGATDKATLLTQTAYPYLPTLP